MYKRQFTGRMRRFAGVLTTIILIISMAACAAPQKEVNTGAGATGAVSAQEPAAAGATGAGSAQEPAAVGATGAGSAQEPAAVGATGAGSALDTAAVGAAETASLWAAGTAGTAGTEDRPLRVHLAGMPGEPDPTRVMDADTASLLKQVSEGLTVLDENGEPAPGAAREWEVSEDGLVWTFTLQDDLRWSDGQTLEAADFAAIFRQTADPASEVLYGSHLTRNIAGYEDVLNGEKDALDVSAEDADTLVVRLTAPDPDFARKCASWALLPVRELVRRESADAESGDGTDTADAESGDGTDTADAESEDGTDTADADSVDEADRSDAEAADGTETTDAEGDGAAEASDTENDGAAEDPETESADILPPGWETLTGNGPYIVESFREGEGYLLKKNPYYHAGEKTPFDAVLWMVSGDANEEYSGFLNGEMDAFSGIPVEEEAALTGSGAWQKNRTGQESVPGNEQDNTTEDSSGTAAGDSAELAPYYDQTIVPDTLGLLFNCRKEELEDLRVRRALSVAADRAYITAEILGGLYAPVASLAADDDPLSHAPAEALLSLMETNDELRQRIEGDSEEAKELLAAAGYPDGKGFPVLTCLAREDDVSYLIAEYLVSVWKDLGIEIRVEPEKAEDIAQEKAAGTFDMLCGSIFLASDVASEELAGYVTDSNENVCGFSSESYDRLLTGAVAEKEEKAGDAESGAEESEEEEKQAGEEASRAEPEEETAGSAGGWTDAEYAGRMQEAVKILAQELPCAPLAMRRLSWLRSEDCADIFCDVSGCWQIWKKTDADSGAAAAGRQEDAASENAASENAAFESVASENASSESAEEDSAPGNHPDGSSDAGKAESGRDGENKGAGLIKLLFPGRAEKSGTGLESPFVGKVQGGSTQKPDNFLTRLFSSDRYFEKTDTSAWLTRQAWLLGGTGSKATRLVSLPKYTQVHLTGTGNERYARIDVDGKFHYLEADRVTADENVLQQLRREEEEQNLQMEMLTASVHEVKESELADHAADVRAETERVLAEIEHHEMIKTQTRNPNWDGPVLSRSKGSVTGPSGKETYYNLNMSGVVNIMRRMGNTDEYWVRDDGCKMLGDYIMCAANLSVHPRGSYVESSLGTCIVCDTGGFASRNSNQLDIAVTW